MRSIRNHLSVGLGAALVVVFVLAGIASSVAIRQAIRDYMITRLDHDAESLLTAIGFDAADGTPFLAGNDPVFDRAYSGHYFKITAGSEVLRSRSLWADDIPVPAVAPGAALTLQARGPGDAPLLVRAHGFQRRGHVIVIAVAEDFGPVRATILRWQAGFAAATLVAVLLVLLLQRRLLSTGLAPLERTRSEVRELEHGARNGLTTDAPAEVLPLIHALNRLLDTLRERLGRSRKSAGDLAHGLKTPLSMVQSLVERPGVDAATRRELIHQLTLIRGRIERELRRARLMGASVPGALFRPPVDIPDLVATLRQIHRDAGLEVTSRITGTATFPADREDMVELLGNLLDNACKWAAGRVEVVADAGPETLLLTIEDDGPGMPGEALERLARRGQRLDETREGHGLGLAIVRDVVDFYGGELRLGPSARLGGLEVTVRLRAHARGHTPRDSGE